MASKRTGGVCLLVGCLTSQQHASVSQGRICSDKFMCCHTEIEVADQTFHLIQSQYIDTGPTSPSTDPITPGAWQGSHWSANFEVIGIIRPRKDPGSSGIRTRDLPLSRWTPLPLGQRGVSTGGVRCPASGSEPDTFSSLASGVLCSPYLNNRICRALDRSGRLLRGDNARG